MKNSSIINVDSQSISYCEKGNGKGTVLFVHGNSLSAQTFINQWESDIFDDFKLVLVDLPGCGKSPNLNDPNQYSIQFFSNLIIKLVEQLALKNVVLCGHSLGGHIALEALEKHDEVKGIFIFGTPPLTVPLQLEKAFLPHPASQYLFAEKFSEEATKIILDGFFSDHFEIPFFITDNLKNADGKLRSGLLASAGRGEFENEIQTIDNTNKRVAILHSENDKLVNADYFSLLDESKLWRKNVQFIGKGGHFPQMENPKEFNQLLFEFCSEF